MSSIINIFDDFLIISGGFILVVNLGKYIWRYLKDRKIKKDLHPFYSESEIKSATKYYIDTCFQEDHPSNDHGSILVNENLKNRGDKQRLIQFFLKNIFNNNKIDSRFFIVLADTGYGKTSFLINLYLKYALKLFKSHKIKLLPLGFPNIDHEISKICDNEKKTTILLLDALDEDHNAIRDYKARLEEIINQAFYYRKIIITCRTHFFSSEDAEPFITDVFKYGPEKGEHKFKKYYIIPFNTKDILKYLNKRFAFIKFWNYTKKSRAKELALKSISLFNNPLLLSYIDELIEKSVSYKYDFQIYEELIDMWIERESLGFPYDERNKYKHKLFKFSKKLAVNIYLNFEKRKGYYIEEKELNELAYSYDITLSKWDIKSKSLLNRNAIGHYKFVHKSILEFFLILNVIEDISMLQTRFLKDMEQATVFFNDYINILIDLIKGDEEIIRYAEGWTTRQIKYEIGSLLIKKATQEKKKQAIAYACSAILTQIGTPVIDHIVRALNTSENPAFGHFCQILEYLGSPAIKSLLYALKNEEYNEELITAALAICGESEIDTIIQALNNESAEIRCGASIALGHLKSYKATRSLISLLKDKNEKVRDAASVALGFFGDIKDSELIIDILNNKDYMHRKIALLTLGRMKSSKHLNVIIKSLDDENIEVRKVSILALGEIGSDEAIKVLINILENKEIDLEQRAIASIALREIGLPAIKYLDELLQKEKDFNTIGLAKDALKNIKKSNPVGLNKT